VVVGPGAGVIAFVVAMVSRLLSTGAELVSISLAYLAFGGKLPTPPATTSESEQAG
jgi:hypothetical protein